MLRKSLVWDNIGYGLFGLKWSEFCRALPPGHNFIGTSSAIHLPTLLEGKPIVSSRDIMKV